MNKDAIEQEMGLLRRRLRELETERTDLEAALAELERQQSALDQLGRSLPFEGATVTDSSPTSEKIALFRGLCLQPEKLLAETAHGTSSGNIRPDRYVGAEVPQRHPHACEGIALAAVCDAACHCGIQEKWGIKKMAADRSSQPATKREVKHRHTHHSSVVTLA